MDDVDTLSRRTVTDPQGRPVLSFAEGTRSGRPWADLAEVLAPGAVEAVFRELPGWVVSGDEEFGRALLAAGARPLRHAHAYSRDLRAAPGITGFGCESKNRCIGVGSTVLLGVRNPPVP